VTERSLRVARDRHRVGGLSLRLTGRPCPKNFSTVRMNGSRLTRPGSR
jgi:hypothetical protein